MDFSFYRIPKNWLAHKYMACGKGSGIPYLVINSPWFFPYWIPKNWLAHKYMDCGKGSGIPYLVFSSPRVIFSPKELASPEQTATGKDMSNPFIWL